MKAHGIIFYLCILFLSPLFAAKLEVISGDIYLKMDGKQVRLTEDGNNSEPSLSPSGEKIVFIHKNGRSQIVLLDLTSKAREVILNEKADAEASKNMQEFSNLTFSDDTMIYFSTVAWVTSNAIHRLNIQTLKSSFVTDGNDYVVIKSGKMKGYLIVNKHKYKADGGSYDDDWLVSPSGQTIQKVKNKELYKVYK